MRTGTGLVLLAVGILSLVASSAHAGEPYQKIQVLLPEGLSARDVLSVNPDLELMGLGDGDVVLLSRPSLTAKLESLGWRCTVLQPDLEAYYASRQGKTLDYGVWHTYDEMLAEMNLLHAQYPDITTAPFSLGTTLEGRTIWAIKVSDNPDVQEDEPEVLHDGMHHAREIMTVEMLLYFARYLCENYGTDPLCTFLVDNRQTTFVPIVNVDGFVYNETTNPNGGGMWRKNRRNNGNGCYGVDNNRNYPYEWVGPGSSTDPCQDTYRGLSAGSEAENQAMMNYINAHDFVTHDSWHSVAGMILIPWAYTSNHTPDDALLRAIAGERASENGYTIGQPPEILYSVNGGFFDWAYGEQVTKPKIYSFCTEIGGSDFWPAPAERDPLIAENLHSILYLTQIAGATATCTALAVSGGDGNGRLDPGETANLLCTVANEGILSDLTGAVVRVEWDDPYVALLDASAVIGTIGHGSSWTNTAEPFAAVVEAGCPTGRTVTFTVIVDADGGIHSETPYVLTVGQLAVIASNDFEDAGEEWAQDASHTAATGAFVRVDPVATTFQPGDDTTPAPGVNALITAQNPGGLASTDDVDGGVAAARSPDYDLSAYGRARVSLNYFHGQRDAGDDATGDFFRIDVSPDAGGSWVNLVQIGDVATSPTWRNLDANLGDFIPLTNQVRFRVRVSDSSAATDLIEGGLDDFTLTAGGPANEAPGAPAPSLPASGAEVSSPVTLVVENATDPESDPLTYGFRVYTDPEFTDLVASVEDIAEGTGTTSWTTGALDLGTYHWRAYAEDATQKGLCSASGSFTVTSSTTGADGPVPDVTAALLAGPNPSASGTRIRYFVPATTTSRLAVFDPQGRLVRALPTVPSASGWREIVWDGADDAGRRVASGSYWVRLWTPLETRTVRVVRIE